MRRAIRFVSTAAVVGVLGVSMTPSTASAMSNRCSEVARKHPYRLLAFYFWNVIAAGVWEHYGCPRGVID